MSFVHVLGTSDDGTVQIKIKELEIPDGVHFVYTKKAFEEITVISKDFENSTGCPH